MKKCKFEDLIDHYLLNKLNQEEKEKFEEHYFNCPSCFQKMTERDELISVIKNKGDYIFQERKTADQPSKLRSLEKIFAFFTPTRWAVVATATVIMLVVIFAVIPQLKTSSPQFFINEDIVRSKSITLISPVIDINEVPSQFRWKSLGKNVHYKIYLYNDELLWTTETENDYITLPQEVKENMRSGEQYSWQVKAFSSDGTLISVSSRVRFKITP